KYKEKVVGFLLFKTQPNLTEEETQAMSGFNRGKWLVMLTVIVMLMNSCVTSQKTTVKKGMPEKKAMIPATELTEEKAPALEIPNYPENVAFSTVTGFNEYVIGPGDILTITEWKTTGPSAHKLPVRPDGKISFSFFEDIKVAGLTPTQVDDLITSQLEGFVKKPRIDVVVTVYRSKKVSLFGEINRVSGVPQSGPGIYPLKGKTKLTELLLDAGSETTKADLKNVELIRHGRLYKLNLLSAMRLKDLSQDVLIENGDKITIPLLPQFKKEKESESHAFVMGEVQQSGWFKFTGKATVSEMISKAQGPSIISADLRHVKVVRGSPENPVLINADLKKLFYKADMSQNVQIMDGDVIFVPRTGLVKTRDFLVKVGSILSVVLTHPASFREQYTTGGSLRIDTNVSTRSLEENKALGGFAGANP
ncbi:MAG: polysaccharide biosynthesis/export family protein, partial [Candidatus Scalindua sp.]